MPWSWHSFAVLGFVVSNPGDTVISYVYPEAGAYTHSLLSSTLALFMG